ncbi:TetR/AcrR family transcriptional regulator [Nesterenkonia muleiensis]|uniref:TetR/AcrR family transcriptional regulator n=1 Tax=Nesterenkonia muleiensis TaxID=2282648 RepID=UPI000E76AE58|nr:TetR/AcrR family transcriptional regulator [Nesterenkonia muleiensis]
MSEQAAGTDRRSEIAEAGIRLIASRGVRALTHRAIDAELALPVGSTSYYARTRRDLTKLIVQRLATRTLMDMGRMPIPDRPTVPQAAALIAHGLDMTLVRADEHLARIALHIEYRSDPAMLEALAGDPPLRPRLIRAAEGLLSSLGVAEPARHAHDLVALMDSLLMQRAVRGAKINVEDIVRAYLDGISQAKASD